MPVAGIYKSLSRQTHVTFSCKVSKLDIPSTSKSCRFSCTKENGWSNSSACAKLCCWVIEIGLMVFSTWGGVGNFFLPHSALCKGSAELWHRPGWCSQYWSAPGPGLRNQEGPVLHLFLEDKTNFTKKTTIWIMLGCRSFISKFRPRHYTHTHTDQETAGGAGSARWPSALLLQGETGLRSNSSPRSKYQTSAQAWIWNQNLHNQDPPTWHSRRKPLQEKQSCLCFCWTGCCLRAMYCMSSWSLLSGESGFTRMP